MLLRCCVAYIGTILLIIIENVFGRPGNINFENCTIKKEPNIDNENKSKSRILTHPPKLEFGREQEILFPDDDDDEKIPFISRIGGNPKCSDGLPFCEDVDAYPYNHLKRVLQQNPMFTVFFGQDEVSYEITNRIGNEDERFVCRSITKTIFPKVGQNKNNKWKFIINQGEEDGFIQGVQIEICKNPEEECDIPGSILIGSGYLTTCKQKYVYRRLLSVNDEGSPSPDVFKLPSACCCSYRQNVDFLSRIGREQTPVSKKHKT